MQTWVPDAADDAAATDLIPHRRNLIQGSPAGHFLKHGRVALSGGRRFGAAWDQHVRLNFATSRPILRDVVDRVAKALGR